MTDRLHSHTPRKWDCSTVCFFVMMEAWVCKKHVESIHNIRFPLSVTLSCLQLYKKYTLWIKVLLLPSLLHCVIFSDVYSWCTLFQLCFNLSIVLAIPLYISFYVECLLDFYSVLSKSSYKKLPLFVYTFILFPHSHEPLTFSSLSVFLSEAGGSDM